MSYLPPVQYDHPYDGPVIEIVLPAAEVARRCGGENIEACTLFRPNFKGDKLFIVLPKVGPGGVSQRQQDVLRRHEIGHGNGWGDNHAGAR